MCHCVITLFSHLFGVPVTWRLKRKWRRLINFPDNIQHTLNRWSKRDMEWNYDEDLNKNSYFQELQNNHANILEKAISEGWILCVPRSSSFSKASLLEEDFLAHVLIPSDELPATHFRTLSGIEVRLCNRELTVAYDTARSCSAQILFEETFYTEDSHKYQIWCIERPLEQSSVTSYDTVPILKNLRECVDLLWTEIIDKRILERLDTAIKKFEQRHWHLEDKPLQVQRDLVRALYIESLEIVMEDLRLRERTTASGHFLQSIKIAIETYVLHKLRNLLPKAISSSTTFEDASLNKVIRNLHELQLQDLGVRYDLYDSIIRGKLEIARIDGFATVLGKIGCLKRAVRYASQGDSAVSSDDLLPVLIFLVIRAGLPNWIAQLTFMKQFRFSMSCDNEADEAGFLITSLEAAVEHVKSGVLMGSIHPESNHADELVESIDGNKLADNKLGYISIGDLFEKVKTGHISEVETILSAQTGPNIRSDLKLCHPLCTCETCEKTLAKTVHVSLPTVHSRDDRGRTALHVACLYGQSEMVEFLINHGSNIDDVDADGMTPLHCAGARGHQGILLLLLHANADPTIRNAHGDTILHVAAENGHEACVKALFYFSEHTRWFIDPNTANWNGDTALHHAAKWGYAGIVQILLEQGTKPQACNRRGQTPLALAHSTHILRMLEAAAQKYLYPIPRQVSFSRTPNSPESTKSDQGEKILESNYSTTRIRRVERLFSVISEGDVRLACYYLGFESPRRKCTDEASQLCHPLCTCDHCCLIEEIPAEHQKKDALGINSRDSDGQTALHVASAHGHSNLVQMLLDAGVNINLRTKSMQRSALHLACLSDQITVVKMLLNSGNCDVNVRDYGGDTPLHFAIRTGDAKLVESIVRHGGDPKIRNLKGITPLEEAEEKVMVGIIRILTEHAHNSH